MRLISIKRRIMSQILSQLLLRVLSLKKIRKSKIKILSKSQIKNQMKPTKILKQNLRKSITALIVKLKVVMTLFIVDFKETTISETNKQIR